MTNWPRRAWIGTRRLSGTTKARIASLLGRAGTAPRAFATVEALENRTLLAGDAIPDFSEVFGSPGATPVVITLDVNGEGSVTTDAIIDDPSDDDMFQFVMPDDGDMVAGETDFVTVWADTINIASALDSRVSVYDTSGNLIFTGANSGLLTGGFNSDGWAGFIGTEGETYYIRVQGDASTTGEYAIRVDAITSGFTLNAMTGRGQAAGTVAPTRIGDDNVFKVTTLSDAIFDSLATINATATPNGLDTRLDVYDSQGMLIAQDSETGRLQTAFTTIRSSIDNTFYVRVRSDEFVPGSPGASGAYTLVVDAAAEGQVVDPVIRQVMDTGALADGYDTGHFSFQAQGTGLTIITVVGIPLPPLPDPALRIYGDNGALLGFNKLGGAAELQIQLTGGEWYFVVVETFDSADGGAYGIWIETNHTFDPGDPVDDHANTPTEGTADQLRRAFSLATPILWSDPFLFRDGNDNPVAQRGFVVQGLGRGRIHEAGDTDLYSFVPPVDMHSQYEGDNGDEGDALFVGGDGDFTIKGNEARNHIGIWDAADWWPVGPMNPNGAIRAMTVFDPDGDGATLPMLVVAGDFTEIAGLPISHVAAWRWNPLFVQWEWIGLGAGLDGNVHALTVFDDDGEDGDGLPGIFAAGEFTGFVSKFTVDPFTGIGAWGGFGMTLDDNAYALTVWDPPDFDDETVADPILVVGGAFSQGGGLMKYNAMDTGVAVLDVDANAGTDGEVRALAVWDPPDPPMGDEVLPQLVIGGDFDNAGGLARPNITLFHYGLDTAVAPNSTYLAMGAGLNDTVYALTPWDRDADGEDFEEELVAGGAFTASGGTTLNRIASWGPGWGALGTGMNDEVRVLAQFIDDECAIPTIPNLYAGGDFTNAGGTPAQRIAQYQFNAFLGDWEWLALGTGSTDTVLALQNFNDERPELWDRNDIPASRLQIVVSPTTESFLDTFLTVYDSNLNVIYTNDTISPPFPDPSGMIDQSLQGPGFLGSAFTGIEVTGGETYYIEISGVSGTGRYTISMHTDALAPDFDLDGIHDDTISQQGEVTDAGGWAAAPELGLNTTGNGDGRNFIANPLAAYNARLYEATPSCFQVVQADELAQIETIDDTDLYFFRAPTTGTVEVRLATFGITDQNFERIIDLNTGAVEATQTDMTYNSYLDGVLRAFNNDFEQIAYNDDNAAIAGEYDVSDTGSFNRQFFRRDPRIVFPVIAGEVYFLQVESGQHAAFLADPSATDWRHATGAYELLINAGTNLQFIDDHQNAANEQASVIPIDEATGAGSATGTIFNSIPTNPTDLDSFLFFSPGEGIAIVSVTPDAGSALIPTLAVRDTNGVIVSQGSGVTPGAPIQVTVPATQGERFFVTVGGGGGTQGGYTVGITGLPYSDDYASLAKWIDAEELEVLDFLGTASATGTLEYQGDTEVFKFLTTDFDLATVTVESLSSTLNPFVRIYEVSEDASGQPILLQVAFNDDVSATDTNSSATFAITAPDRTSQATMNTYNYYYIVVSGSDPDVHRGDFLLTLSVTPTDDHADHLQTGLATFIAVNPSDGLGLDTGNIEKTGDSDLFSFVAPAGGTAFVTIGTPGGSTLRPRITVYDPTYTVVLDTADGTDPAPPAQSNGNVSFVVVRNVKYFILIEGLGTSANGRTDTGTYAVSITAPTVDDHANEGEFPLATKIPLSTTTGDGQGTGTIGALTDTDLFFFDAIADGDVEVTLDTPSSVLIPTLSVYGSTGVLITTIAGVDSDTAIVYTITGALEGDRYYLMVEGSFLTTGGYTMTLDGPIPPAPPPGDDDHADVNEFNLATAIILSTLNGNGTDSGKVDTASDTDLFKFSTLADGKVYVQVVTPGGSLLDTSIRVFAPDFTEVAFDATGLPGSNAYVEFNVGAGNLTYYLLVDGLGAGTGSYTVRVDSEPETFYLYYPEGYSHNQIREYISLSNANNALVTYQVTLHFANTSLAPLMVASGAIPALSRGGVTISDGPNGALAGVPVNEPYAVVVTSDAQLGGIFAHYDFGLSLGEAMTEAASNIWSFASVERVPGVVNDFFVVYNPNSTAAEVTLTAYRAGAAPVVLTQTLQAHRRGGWNVNAENALPTGTFAVVITSKAATTGDDHVGIVAGLSHYDTGSGEGFTLLGDPEGGQTEGVIAALTQGTLVSSEVAIFNATNTTATVSINGSYIRANLPDAVRSIQVAPRSTVTVSGATLGFIANQPIGIRFTSNVPVTVSGAQTQFGDGDATQAASQAALGWFFGDAFINAGSAGVTYFETLNLHNPTGSSQSVNVFIYFSDGTQASTLVNVAANDFAELRLDQFAGIVDRGGLNYFSVEARSSSPFIASFTHYDLFLGGGWTTKGSPIGLPSDLTLI